MKLVLLPLPTHMRLMLLCTRPCFLFVWLYLCQYFVCVLHSSWILVIFHFVSLSVPLPVEVCLSVSPSVFFCLWEINNNCMCLSVCLSVCLCLNVCLCVYLFHQQHCLMFLLSTSLRSDWLLDSVSEANMDAARHPTEEESSWWKHKSINWVAATLMWANSATRRK